MTDGRTNVKNRRVAVLAAAVLGVLAISPATAANAEDSESLDALLARVAPEVRENLYDGASAARGAQPVTPATVPTTGAEPVTTHGEDGSVSIWLPTATAVAEDSVAGEGVRLFEHGNGATSVPLVKDDGSVQILTLIDDAAAPESYSYSVDVAEGATLAVDADGAVHITSATGEFIWLCQPHLAQRGRSDLAQASRGVGAASRSKVKRGLRASSLVEVGADRPDGVTSRRGSSRRA